MLRKSNRLSKRQFDDYFKRGRRHHFPHCTIVYTPSDTFHGSVVVSKKVAKQAVRRNKLRRRIYAQLYQVVKQSGGTGVYIVLTKPSLLTLSRVAANQTIAANIATVQKSA